MSHQKRVLQIWPMVKQTLWWTFFNTFFPPGLRGQTTNFELFVPKCRPEIEGRASVYLSFFIFGCVFPLGSDRTKPDVGATAPVPGAALKYIYIYIKTLDEEKCGGFYFHSS